MPAPENWREPVRYEIEALSLRDACRSDIKPGDRWEFLWNTPAGFCPKCMSQVYAYMITMECGGDLRQRGSKESNSITFMCPDGEVRFRMTGHRLDGLDGLRVPGDK